MDRLTYTAEQRKAEGIGYALYFNKELCSKIDERLAAYEDTGLTPDEIAALRAELDAYKADIEAGRLVPVRTEIPIQKYEHYRGLEDCGESPYVECPECGNKVFGANIEDEEEYYCPNFCDNCGLRYDLEAARAALEGGQQ